MERCVNIDEMLRLFVNQLTDYAIILLDIEGHIMSWTAGAETIKGYAADEVIGQHFSLFYTPEARMVGHPERELVIAASAGKFEEAGWRVRKDGTRFWADVKILAITDDEGDLMGYGKITRDITEAKQAAEQMANVTALLETTSRTDFLTGLDNRRSLDKIMDVVLASARRHDRPLVLAMLDLDKFKQFNDDHGHQNGDRYLRRAAIAWRKLLRREDVLARYGGEEFTVLMPETQVNAALDILNRVRAATPSPLTCSIGVAQWDGSETASALLSRADRCLYAAKAGGRNRIEVSPNRLTVVPTTRASRIGEEEKTSGFGRIIVRLDGMIGIVREPYIWEK